MKNIEIKSAISKETLEILYKIIIFVSALSLVINFLNKRPFEVYVLSIVSFSVAGCSYYLSKRKNKKYISKIIFLFYFAIIYIPYAWLTSPGSKSAMPFFSLFVIIISVLFIDDKREIIFSFIVIFETVVLFLLEYFDIIYLESFSNQKIRLIDITTNYVFVSISIVIVLYRIVSYYLNQHEKVYLNSVIDDLTGVYNRRFLMKTLISEESYLLKEIDYYTVVMIDINNFKEVNDEYGHLVGDDVLKKLGDILKINTRKYDICSRYGGDEFLIILSEASKKDAKKFINRVSKSFKNITKKYHKVNFSLAFGIADSKEKSVREIIELADKNLYQTKRKNR